MTDITLWKCRELAMKKQLPQGIHTRHIRSSSNLRILPVAMVLVQGIKKTLAKYA